MEVTEKLLKAVMKEVGTDPTAIAAKIAEARRCWLSVKTLETTRRRIIVDHKSTLSLLEKDFSEARSKCKHWATTFHPDASGNNDSFSTCDVCGAELP